MAVIVEVEEIAAPGPSAQLDIRLCADFLKRSVTSIGEQGVALGMASIALDLRLRPLGLKLL